MARGLLKALVVGTPETAIFAFTGSSMCAVWVNVAATAPNGISMLVHNARCHLPAAVSAAASSESWQFLQSSRPGVPANLADYISHSLPAMQVHLVREYLGQIVRPSTEAELLAFVQDFEVNKLLMEVRACKFPVWRLVDREQSISLCLYAWASSALILQVCKDFIPTLASLSPSQRLVLLHLVSDDGSLGSPDGGIAVLMAPYMTTLGVDASGNNIMRLEIPWHAHLIKVWASCSNCIFGVWGPKVLVTPRLVMAVCHSFVCLSIFVSCFITCGAHHDLWVSIAPALCTGHHWTKR